MPKTQVNHSSPLWHLTTISHCTFQASPHLNLAVIRWGKKLIPSPFWMERKRSSGWKQAPKYRIEPRFWGCCPMTFPTTAYFFFETQRTQHIEQHIHSYCLQPPAQYTVIQQKKMFAVEDTFKVLENCLSVFKMLQCWQKASFFHLHLTSRLDRGGWFYHPASNKICNNK